MDKYEMRSIKSTIGGACSALGKGLMGLPVASVVFLGNDPRVEMFYVWVVGYSIDLIGGFLANLFAADKSDVRRLMAENEDDAGKRFATKEEAKIDREDTKTMLRGKADVEDK